MLIQHALCKLRKIRHFLAQALTPRQRAKLVEQAVKASDLVGTSVERFDDSRIRAFPPRQPPSHELGMEEQVIQGIADLMGQHRRGGAHGGEPLLFDAFAAQADGLGNVRTNAAYFACMDRRAW